jgi:nucleotide-binding universal stress UspA family protein
MFRTFLIASARPEVDPSLRDVIRRVAELYGARLLVAIVQDADRLVAAAAPAESLGGERASGGGGEPAAEAAVLVMVGEFSAAISDKGHEADVIVVEQGSIPGPDGRASSAEAGKLVRQAPRPVWLARLPVRFPEHILVGYDGSAHSGRALHAGANLAETLGCRLTVLHVDEARDELAQAVLLKRAAGYCEPYRMSAEFVGLAGPAAGSIRDYARSCGCDLLVVGAAGLGYLRGLLFGSVAGQLIDDAPCSVLIAK